MKAVIVKAHGDPKHMVIEEVPTPTPGPGQVRIKLHMTSVNFADIKGRRAPYRHFQAPYTPGFDGVGVIDALGEGVDTSWQGQRVAAYVKGGSYAEYALSTPALCYPIPDEVSDEDGAAIGIWITSHNALHWAGRVQKGETILIHAASGGVGSCALQLARLQSPKKLIATVGHEEKKTACTQADHVLLHHADDLTQQIDTLTDGKGVDVILDTLGGAVFDKSIQCIAPFGRYVIFGHSTGTSGTFVTAPLHRHNVSILGYSSGGYRKTNPEALKPSAERVLQLLKEKHVKTLQGPTYPLAQVQEAHQLFEDRLNVGKVYLRI
ncbi:MAG: zinc-binding alcohol dehydrogenase [Deltaproteobacteria bacterium]|nr:zinc-binding alcohol dehydrogenase [Deltaproteobacteria bacterium]MBU51617.1 zinc-binding alcohol dehydrogenase [Deltaproteobacteria bacterium]|tara:strand:- start:5390 stop:6355 length:966 start_codon:yes stop_codon:yes gene_type:complete